MKRTQKTVALHQLVNQVSQSLMPRMVGQRNLMINDLHKEMWVTTDENILVSVLRTLLDATVTHSQSNCIRVSAKIYGNIILVQIKSDNTNLDGSIADSLYRIDLLAEQLGGCVTVSNNYVKGTTVAFSFYNQKQVA